MTNPYATNAPRDTAGRYAKKFACDACCKSVNYPNNSYTDYDVCGSGDGPGFMLCARKRCMTKRDALDLAGRKALYETGRAKNDAAESVTYHPKFTP